MPIDIHIAVNRPQPQASEGMTVAGLAPAEDNDTGKNFPPQRACKPIATGMTERDAVVVRLNDLFGGALAC